MNEPLSTWAAMREVLKLELTQRARSTRWRALLIAWFVALAGAVALQTAFTDMVFAGGAEGAEFTASATLIIVLLVGLLVAPAQTATSVNGDRRDGVLALVQAAPVPARAVGVGKLMAAWIASLAFLVVSLPVLLWTVVAGGMPWWAMLLGIVLVALLLLAVSGVGLGLSALTPRTASSTMLSYLVVAFLLIGLPLTFLLTVPMLERTETRDVAYMTSFDADPDPARAGEWCAVRNTEVSVLDTRPTAWLFLANPVVVVSDALPYSGSAPGPASLARHTLDQAFDVPEAPPETCEELAESMREAEGVYEGQPGEHLPGWKWIPGLAINLLLGGAGLAFAIRRLAVPVDRLPDGVRIA